MTEHTISFLIAGIIELLIIIIVFGIIHFAKRKNYLIKDICNKEKDYLKYIISPLYRFLTSYRYKYIITDVKFSPNLYKIYYLYQLRYDKFRKCFQITDKNKFDTVVFSFNNNIFSDYHGFHGLSILYIDDCLKYNQNAGQDKHKYDVDIQEYDGKLFINKYVTSKYIDVLKERKECELSVTKFNKINYISTKIINDNN